MYQLGTTEPITLGGFLVVCEVKDIYFTSFNFELNRKFSSYNGICLVGHLSKRTFFPKICLTGQFIFLGICLTGQFENSGKLTVLVMLNKSV